MSGQTMSYKKYNDYVKDMPAPVMPSQLPKKKMNIDALVKYAKQNHICIAELSVEEQEKIIDMLK